VSSATAPTPTPTRARARPHVAVADTGTGNLRSVEKALTAAGADVLVTADADAIARADKVVVPGQGAFGGTMAGLTRGGGALEQAVRGAIAAGKPYLGICLGLQVLFEGSDEDPSCRGLGIFPGRVRRLPETAGLKIPHMGWNATRRGPAKITGPSKLCPILKQIGCAGSLPGWRPTVGSSWWSCRCSSPDSSSPIFNC